MGYESTGDLELDFFGEHDVPDADKTNWSTHIIKTKYCRDFRTVR